MSIAFICIRFSNIKLSKIKFVKNSISPKSDILPTMAVLQYFPRKWNQRVFSCPPVLGAVGRENFSPLFPAETTGSPITSLLTGNPRFLLVGKEMAGSPFLLHV
ncbi:hypothetical protein CDAR_73381 [Caerostris darwini]|uniref:Uncharacterized protein n=1 Tax=Caerostris darwini TaxID=1538125 RepID=A0AAV4VKD5_9ARAC|nr:hypothetical protein CDAR_73381 [Caerostris darwini]